MVHRKQMPHNKKRPCSAILPQLRTSSEFASFRSILSLYLFTLFMILSGYKCWYTNCLIQKKRVFLIFWLYWFFLNSLVYKGAGKSGRVKPWSGFEADTLYLHSIQPRPVIQKVVWSRAYLKRLTLWSLCFCDIYCEMKRWKFNLVEYMYCVIHVLFWHFCI